MEKRGPVEVAAGHALSKAGGMKERRSVMDGREGGVNGRCATRRYEAKQVARDGPIGLG
jgi:hypothetical protein